MGAEWDVSHIIALNDELSRLDARVLSALSGASIIGVPPIVRFGTLEQRQKWLPRIFTGNVSFYLGATERTGQLISHLLLLSLICRAGAKTRNCNIVLKISFSFSFLPQTSERTGPKW